MDAQLFNVLGIEVFVALKVKMLVFWSVELYSFMVRHRVVRKGTSSTFRVKELR
jgi:hypothetical protein